MSPSLAANTHSVIASRRHRHQSPVLNEKAAAEYVGMSVPFLRQSRVKGEHSSQTTAPVFLKIGKSVRYRIADLDSWLLAQRKEPSSCTADKGGI